MTKGSMSLRMMMGGNNNFFMAQQIWITYIVNFGIESKAMICYRVMSGVSTDED
jgi:hypothetical protein